MQLCGSGCSEFRVLSSLRLRSVNGFNDSINQLFNDSTIQQGYLLSYILRTNDLPFFQGEYPKGEGFIEIIKKTSLCQTN